MRPPQADLFWNALSTRGNLGGFIQRRRDLTVINILENYALVLACDSNASIGLKEHDYVRHDLYTVGRSAVKVPLMEVLAAGATPFTIVDNLCVELEPTGLGILEGIRFEVERLGLDPDLVINGSAEKNMPTTQTGLGVTVLGIAPKDRLMIGTSRPGDLVVCVGIPKNAPEAPYLEGDPDIMDPVRTRTLRSLEYIHEVVPVGSHGVKYEMDALAEGSSLTALQSSTVIRMHQSAGASTCVIASLQRPDLQRLVEGIDRPVNIVGYLKAKE